MKVLFIGGTGNISSSVSKLCLERGIDLYLLNRGKSESKLEGVKHIVADVSDFEQYKKAIHIYSWDVVVNWIAFTEKDVMRDIELFNGKTKQYIFISSASAYQKPPSSPFITEETPLSNPFWKYSRDKIRCEEILNIEYRDKKFPVTIIRPSLTYDKVIPLPIGAWNEFTTVDRIKKGKKIIVHGDGTSLWTLTHSKDFAKGICGLFGNEKSIGETFHITSDEVLTWNQIFEEVANVYGAKANIVHIPTDFLAKYDQHFYESLWGDKAHSVIFDNSKIKKYVLGFKATISFAEGIKKTISWFEADKDRQVINDKSNNLIEKIISDYEISFLK